MILVDGLAVSGRVNDPATARFLGIVCKKNGSNLDQRKKYQAGHDRSRSKVTVSKWDDMIVSCGVTRSYQCQSLSPKELWRAHTPPNKHAWNEKWNATQKGTPRPTKYKPNPFDHVDLTWLRIGDEFLPDLEEIWRKKGRKHQVSGCDGSWHGNLTLYSRGRGGGWMTWERGRDKTMRPSSDGIEKETLELEWSHPTQTTRKDTSVSLNELILLTIR